MLCAVTVCFQMYIGLHLSGKITLTGFRQLQPVVRSVRVSAMLSVVRIIEWRQENHKQHCYHQSTHNQEVRSCPKSMMGRWAHSHYLQNEKANCEFILERRQYLAKFAVFGHWYHLHNNTNTTQQHHKSNKKKKVLVWRLLIIDHHTYIA